MPLERQIFQRPRPDSSRIYTARPADLDSLIRYDGPASIFARASAATWFDGATLRRWAAGELRKTGTARYALEGLAAIGTEAAEAFDNAAIWVPSGASVIAGWENGPDGENLTADRVSFVGAAADEIGQSFLGTPDSLDVWFSLFYKEPAPGGPGFGMGTPDFRVSGRDKASVTTYTAIEIFQTNLWRRVSHGFNFGVGGADPKIAIVNAATANGVGATVHGAQIEAGAFPTSYYEDDVPGASYREADDLVVVGQGIPDEFLTGRWRLDLWPEGSSAECLAHGATQQIYDFTGGAAELALVIDGGAMKVRITDVGGPSTDSAALTWSRGQRIRITIDWVAQTMTISGATTGNGTTSLASVSWAGSPGDLQIGALVGLTLPYFGEIGEPILVR